MSSPLHRKHHHSHQRLARSSFQSSSESCSSSEDNDDHLMPSNSSSGRESSSFSAHFHKHKLTSWYDFHAIESRHRFYRFYQQAVYQQPVVYALWLTLLLWFLLPIAAYDLSHDVELVFARMSVVSHQLGDIFRVTLSVLALICSVFAVVVICRLLFLLFVTETEDRDSSKLPWIKEIQRYSKLVSILFRVKKVTELHEEEASMEDIEMKTSLPRLDAQQRADLTCQLKGVLSTLLQFYIIILLIQKVFQLHCVHEHYVHPDSLVGYWLGFVRNYNDCQQERDSDVLPYVFMLLLAPLVCFLATPGVPVFITGMNLVVGYAVFIVMVLVTNTGSCIPITIPWFVLSLMVVKEVQLRSMHHFLHITTVNHRSRDLLTEQKKLLHQDMHRVMMYLNQAMMPLNCRLQDDFQKWQETARNASSGSSPTMRRSFSNSNHVNHVMMTVMHQYADYMKLKLSDELVSRIETVAWLDAVEDSLASVQALHPTASIELEVMSDEICSHIITDKQWIEESMLTSLSHAVKIAQGSNVTFRISVVEFEEDDERTLIQSCRAQLSSPYRRNTKWKQIESRSAATTVTATSKLSKRVHPLSALSLISLDNHSVTSNTVVSSSQPGLSNKLGLNLRIETNVSNKNKKYFLLFEVEFVDEDRCAELLPPLLEAEQLDSQHPNFAIAIHWHLVSKRMQALDGRCGINTTVQNQQLKRKSAIWFSVPYQTNVAKALQSSSPFILHSASVDNAMNGNQFGVSSRHLHAALGQPLEGLASKGVESMPSEHPFYVELASSRKIRTNILQLLVIDTSSSSSLSISSLSPCSSTSMLPAAVFESYQIITASSIEMATLLITDRWKTSETIFDVIILTVQLPIAKSLDMVRKIRKLELPGQIVSSTWEREVRNPLPRQKILALTSLPDRDLHHSITTTSFSSSMSLSLGIVKRDEDIDAVVDLVLEVPCNICQFDNKIRHAVGKT